MKRQFTSILLFSALLMGGASTFVSCKDYDSDAAYEAQAQANKNIAELIAQRAKDLEDINRKIEDAKCTCTDQKTIELMEKQMEENENILQTLKQNLTNNITNEADVQRAILNLTKNNLENGGLTESVKKLILGDYQDLNTAIEKSDAYKEVLLKLASNNDALADSVKTIWGDLYEENGDSKFVGITTNVDQLLRDMTYTKALAQADSERIDTLSARLYQEIDRATQEVAAKIPSDAHINDLIGTKLQDYYTKTEIDKRVDSLKTAISNLKSSIDDILSKQVSGIIVQASECPVTGYENTPFGVQVGILGAYYGNAVTGFQPYEGNRIEQGTNFVAAGNDNAGTIYVTVNPANVKPDAITLRLVDSQGKAIASTNADDKTPYILEWDNTDRVLKFGVSRAVNTSSNGFYAVRVKLNSACINEAKIWNSTDKENLKAVGKNILEKLKHPKSSNLQLANIASTINSTFNNRLTAYGLEASWQQLGTDGKLVDKKVTSKLGLATIAINPLSFNFLSDGVDVDLPQIPSLETKLDLKSLKFSYDPIDVNTIKDVKITVPNGKNITVVEKEGNKTVTITKDENGVVSDVTFNASNITVQGDDLVIDVSMEEFRKVVNNLNSQMENMITNVTDYINKVNGWTETIDGSYINRINNYIKRFENLLTKANSLLQPAMFYTTSTGKWNQLARVESGASHLKLNGGQATTVFIASSYTAELLAPAYQKELTVNGGATLTADDQSGSRIVLDGNKYKVGFKATKAGVYTITYKARDYSGNEVKKNFFVKVVE